MIWQTNITTTDGLSAGLRNTSPSLTAFGCLLAAAVATGGLRLFSNFRCRSTSSRSLPIRSCCLLTQRTNTIQRHAIYNCLILQVTVQLIHFPCHCGFGWVPTATIWNYTSYIFYRPNTNNVTKSNNEHIIKTLASVPSLLAISWLSFQELSQIRHRQGIPTAAAVNLWIWNSGIYKRHIHLVIKPQLSIH